MGNLLPTDSGAGNGNRTRISSMARTYNSHYTIPASTTSQNIMRQILNNTKP